MIKLSRIIPALAVALLVCASLEAKPSKELKQRQSIKIWDGTSCHASDVTLTPYFPDSTSVRPDGIPEGTAIIVCPGGSYFWLDEQTEGADVAKWLQSNGIAAFVLRYRTGGAFDFFSGSRIFFGGHKHPDMLCDIQRAIELVRENAEEWGVDPEKLGCMGFSAGGHLVMSSGEYFETCFPSKYGIEPSVSLRPDFVAPIYPVVSLTADCTHKRSRRGLLGETKMNNKTMQDSLSLEKHVKPDTPPVFLLNCVDDDIVDYRNSELLDSALAEKGIPHLYTQYKVGGHGFGATPSKQGEETSRWQALFINWLKTIF